jgi:hypothetical protein
MSETVPAPSLIREGAGFFYILRMTLDTCCTAE